MVYTKQFHCGCKIVIVGELHTANIHFCPKHESAPDLYEACKEALEKSHDPIVEGILMKAIAKVEGK